MIGILHEKKFLLYHDYAQSHSSISHPQIFDEQFSDYRPHPPYSPDLAPCDFGLLPHLKIKLENGHFEMVEEIQEKSQVALRAVTKTTFTKIFQQWETRRDRCIAAQRDNFEGDGNLGA